MLKGGENVRDNLNSEDIDRCNKMVEEFIDTSDPTRNLVLADRLMINQCFYHFKHLYKDMNKKKGGGAGFSGPNFGNASQSKTTKEDIISAGSKNMQDECQRLQLLVQQRDSEIGILLNHLNKKKVGGQSFSTYDDTPGIPV